MQAVSLKEGLSNVGINVQIKGEQTPNELSVLPVLDGKKDDEVEVGMSTFIQSVTNVITSLAGGVAIFFIALNSGILLLALGESEGIEKAKKGLIRAVLGLLVIMFAFVITKTIISLVFSGDDHRLDQSEKNPAADENPPGLTN